MNLSIRAIIFDMDGVITNTMPDHYKAWREIFHGAGIHVTHEDVYSREGQRGIHSVRELSEKYNIPFNKKKAERMLLDKENLFKKITRTRFITGARSFIKKMHREDFKLALVTGTSRHEMHRILPDNLFKLFDVVVTGSDVHHGKPHPEPYLLSLKKLKTKANEAVVIENAPFGIQSAKGAGIRCLGLETSLPKKYLKQADAIFPSFKELKQRINFKLKI